MSWNCCGESIDPIIPNVIGSGCVEVDKTDPQNRIITWACPSEVISSDNSVTITEDIGEDWEKIFDLSFSCCDSKVWVCASDDTPGTLDEKLFVTAPITKVIDCEGGTYTLWLDIDYVKEQIEDKFVKVQSGGTSNYLEYLVSTTAPLKRTVSANDLKIAIDETDVKWKRPCGKIRYTDSVEITGANLTTWLGWFSGFDNKQSNNVAQTATNNAITIVKSWWYRLSIRGIIEFNEWLHAFRVITLSSNTNVNWSLDWKMGAGNTTRGIDTTWIWYSMYGGLNIVSVNATENVLCAVWDIITLWYRWSTQQSDNTTPMKVRILWDNGSSYTSAINVWWFSLSWEYIDDIF